MEAVEENIGSVTVQQAAKMIGVHRGAIYQAIEAGRLKPVKVLGHTVLRRMNGETGYLKAGEHLRRDFAQRCAYCLIHE